MKIVFAGGGTAGHINPAVALASYIREKNPDAKILFVGTRAGMEKELVPKNEFKIEFIKAQGFRRKITAKNIHAASESFKGLLEARKILKQFKPDVVVGTGGYVSGPVILAASLLGIKTLIHEQNAIPGATTKILAKRADKIAISFKETERYFKRKDAVVLTGNPLRMELFKNSRDESRKELSIGNEFLIVCIAGSLGAEKINQTMENIIPMLKDKKDIKLIYATGKRYFESVITRLSSMGINANQLPNVTVCEYIYDVAKTYAAADLMITRAGAITVSELAALGKPSIIIPSPNVTNNHQFYNAKILSDAGAAVLLEEKDLSASTLYKKITEIKDNEDMLIKMSKNAKEKGLKDSTHCLYDVLNSLFD